MNSYVSTYDPSHAQELAEELRESCRIQIEAVQVVVYRSNLSRKKRHSKLSAYKDAAWGVWKQAHYPVCMCRRDGPQNGREDFFCPEHGERFDSNERYLRELHRQLVICRLARWLMWRDGAKIPRRLKTEVKRAKEMVAEVLDPHPY